MKNGFESLEQLSLAAQKGDPAAQERLALSYVEGWGVERDYDKARGWYEKAAAQDDPGGHFGLAVIHALGWGVPTNEVEAYMHLVLMTRRRKILDERWNAETVNRMLATADQVAGRLTDSERARAERLADDWKRLRGQG